ncbi:MAG: integrase [Gallionellaceae bacterium]|nr:MAG: integrase [Gallionellaceae bacterium]
MSTMIIEVYDAFKSAGAPEEKAQAAAKAIADYDNRFNKIEADLGGIKGELSALKMMVGIVIALNMAIIGLIVNTIIMK